MIVIMNKRSPIQKRLRRRNGSRIWNFWGYDWTGKRYEASTHQTDREAAINAALEIERERASKPALVAEVKTVCTLSRAFELLKAHDVRVEAAPNTIEFHAGRAAHLLRLLGKDALCAFTIADINKYTDTRLVEGASRHTIQKEHRVLRHMLRLAHVNGECQIDGSALKVEGFVKARSYYSPGDVWLETVEQIEALLREVVAERRDDVVTILNTGLRRRELLTLTRSRVDLKGRVLSVETLDDVTLKTEGAERKIPLNDTMMALLRKRILATKGSEPLFTEWGSGNRDLNAAWTRARKIFADAPESLCFNDLRRTFCSLMKAAGVSADDCADLLGHADITMVRQVYGKVQLDRLHKAVATLPEIKLCQDSVNEQSISISSNS